jgi:hypothetical protein
MAATGAMEKPPLFTADSDTDIDTQGSSKTDAKLTVK